MVNNLRIVAAGTKSGVSADVLSGSLSKHKLKRKVSLGFGPHSDPSLISRYCSETNA